VKLKMTCYILSCCILDLWTFGYTCTHVCW